jgi:hypothetical protein
LFTLPGETVVFSGHGEESSIAKEIPNLKRFENQ